MFSFQSTNYCQIMEGGLGTFQLTDRVIAGEVHVDVPYLKYRNVVI